MSTFYPILDSLDSLGGHEAVRSMDSKEHNKLASEVRLRISEVVAENGGHLGPNLGTVELLIACHSVFDFKKDRLLFDVGHQAYPHKILTGRHETFRTLRQKNGLSGYPNQAESPYDVYRGGHASTAISTGLGLLKGMQFDGRQRDRHVVAIVGDGSLTGGMAFEGLNHAGSLKERLIIILNDNTMSISPTVGALSKMLNNIRHKKIVSNLRNEFVRIVKRIPKFGAQIEEVVQLILEEAKTLINPKQIFTTLGFDYIGPLKGHDVGEIASALRQAKSMTEPVLIHVLTEKGKGYLPEGAEGKSVLGPHALSPKKKPKRQIGVGSSEAQAPDEVEKPQKTYSKCFAEGLVRLAKGNPDIIGITAAMLEGTGLLHFQKAFPERCFDVGICEAHATGFAAGLATSGRRPFFAVYSTFLQRAFDQIFHEVVLQQRIPVVFCIDRAGLVGDDGPSHHGMYDIAYLRLYPNMVVMAPKDGKELVDMMSFALTLEGPSAIRYPKDVSPEVVFSGFGHRKIELGKSEVLTRGRDVAFLAYGSMVPCALEVAERLESHGISSTVVNARFAKPIDADMVRRLVEKHSIVMSLEEGTNCGGFGSAILEVANLHRLPTDNIHVVACPDKLVEHASRSEQLQHCSLDVSNVTTRAISLLRKSLGKSQKPAASFSLAST